MNLRRLRSSAFARPLAVALAIALSTTCSPTAARKQPATSPGSPSSAPGVSIQDLERLKQGGMVRVSLKDGGTVVGAYQGLRPAPEKAYGEAYERARAELRTRADLPALGKGASVRDVGGHQLDRELVGFGAGFAILRAAGEKRESTLPFASMEQLQDAEGHSISGVGLQALADAGLLPLKFSIALDASSTPTVVMINDIRAIEVARDAKGGSHSGRYVAALVVVIGLLVAVAVANKSEPPPPPPTTSSSCPFVYSFNGRELVLDAEPLGGAIVEAGQRGDWSRLENLAESGGEYRLRVANEMQEVEYLDEVKLQVIDHPTDARAVPDLFGGVHALADPVAPSRARDMRDSDVLDLVGRRDGRVWMANPLGRDPAREADLRDGLVLEFPRPRGAESATLTTRARSTPWMAQLVHHVLALKGRDLTGWYDRVNTDAGAQRSLWNLALGMAPTVRLWTGDEWKAIDLLASLPAVTFGEQAVRLDLRGLRGDVVRLRMDGLPGTCMVDAASLHFGEPPAELSEIAPVSAEASDGRDVREAIRAIDRNRHELKEGEALELRFAAPPRRAGLDRSFVLKTTGYYKILMPAAGEPQSTLFEQVMNDPRALARFSLEDVKGRMQLALAD
jgi:hypothetical protein